jgi:hypothetical protein
VETAVFTTPRSSCLAATLVRRPGSQSPILGVLYRSGDRPTIVATWTVRSGPMVVPDAEHRRAGDVLPFELGRGRGVDHDEGVAALSRC